MTIIVDITTRGPLFAHPNTATAIEQALPEINAIVAQRGHELMIAETAVFREPTGFYRAHLVTQQLATSTLIHDSGIVYGWWLQRGHRRTRFRGYQLWTKATAALTSEVDGLVRRAITRIIGGAR